MEIPKIPGILQIPGNPGKLSKFYGEYEGGLFFNYRKFLKCLVIWEISKILEIYLGSSLNTRDSGEFPKYLGIWGIPQIAIFLKSITAVGSLHCKHKSENLRNIIPIFAEKKAFVRDYRNQIPIFHGIIF